LLANKTEAHTKRRMGTNYSSDHYVEVEQGEDLGMSFVLYDHLWEPVVQTCILAQGPAAVPVLSRINKRFRDLANSNIIWKELALCKLDGDEVSLATLRKQTTLSPEDKDCDWKQIFKNQVHVVRSISFNCSVHIKFSNYHWRAVSIMWVNYDGEEVCYHRNLASGREVLQQTYSSHPWRIYDAKSKQPLLIFIPPQEDKKIFAVDISPHSLQSKNSIDVKFKVQRQVPVSIFWSDCYGRKKLLVPEMGKGEKYRTKSFTKQVFIVQDSLSGEEILLHVTSSDPDSHCVTIK